VPFPNDLLEQARHLANREPKRPKQASLLDHTPMGKVWTPKRDELNAYFKSRPAPGHNLDVLKNLQVITNTFVEMLQHRHTADYDGSAKWSRTDVLEKIESVEAAFLSWREIRDEHEAQNFLVTLFAQGTEKLIGL
jgi:hypothetical protein